MLEYMIGTTRRNGKSLRYLRIKSDAEIGLTGDLVTFTQTQEDKVSVYEVIVGDLLREESGDGLFYRWYEVESVLVETDHTPQLAAEVEDMAQATVAASIVFTVMAERDRSTTPRRRRTPRSLPNGPIPLHIRPERSASTRPPLSLRPGSHLTGELDAGRRGELVGRDRRSLRRVAEVGPAHRGP